jgi:hypothetical protein
MPSKFYSSGKCPPGVLCITPAFVLLGIILVIFVIGAMIFMYPSASTVYVMPQPAVGVAPPISVQVAAGQQGDDRYTRAPKPERHWMVEPDVPTSAEMYGRLPRIPTQGIPEAYQSIGIITMEDGQVLPLFGRRTMPRADRFQYYTRTDTYNPVQLPIRSNKRDCTDDVGCEELFNGDGITVTPTGQRGNVTIYRFDGPKYIP